MKKKQLVKSGDAGQYTVGQVSGSLFPEQLKPGALSALFSSSSSAKTLVFVPAPQPKACPPASGSAPSPGPTRRPKKTLKRPSAAEQKLQDRESALQNADDDGPATARKRTHTHARPDEEEEGEGDPRAGGRRRKNTAEERLKLKRTVFVGNLPASCSKKSLLSLFRPVGVVESVRFRSVVREDPTLSRKVAAIQRKVHPKKQNINAYVVFREEEAAAGALKWNGHEIQTGFHIRVDRVSKRSAHDHKRSIFVGNLPYDVSELPLREHFEECGTVEAVRLVRDRDSGMGKGFGYVLFESPDSVMLALKLDGSTLLERRVRVKRSVKKEKQKKKQRPPAGAPRERTAPDAPRRRTPKGPKHQLRNRMKNLGPKPTPATSFSGETADPAKRSRVMKKNKKKKSRPAVHI
ncbi:RNA-binding protein 34 [Pimephales promelas]|uniref:RNA-binding protein 34 n=1 Tax=Pimephales promelas TaxID=90988 RepID=UPI0019555498|nr:RNA-binding protein 34 [Pimephales promelas]KAG1929696.1 RNA-binding protein [Pimephales promelas]KAG1929697.1 RNA-binding protein [Pimephales promelas]